MWLVDNRTPYAAERNWVRDKAGNHRWLVAVRATFDVADQGARLTPAPEQVPPLLGPEYYGEPGLSSLRYDSDLLEHKPRTDVTVNAHAHAPGGRRAPSVRVTFRVGELRKTLDVYGTRVFYRGPTGAPVPTAPEPFESRPIRWEWAYGGADLRDADARHHRIEARNPIGKGFAVHEAALVGELAPAIEYAGGGSGPAGLGAINRAWSPRRELAGTYDDAWASTKRPLLPDDYDDRFGLSSPVDQQHSEYLRGGESVELSNLSPEGVWRFELPKLYFTFASHFGSRIEQHRGHLASVVLEPERRRLSMVWQSCLPVPRREIDYLDKTIVNEKRYLP